MARTIGRRLTDAVPGKTEVAATVHSVDSTVFDAELAAVFHGVNTINNSGTI